MEVIVEPLKTVILDQRTSLWCLLPYPRHPKGCPNFGKKDDCPPLAKNFKKLVQKPYLLVAVCFDLAEHVRRMIKKHPHWSDAQARCVLYWQPKVNKRLREAVDRCRPQIPNSLVLYKPEANGVHVFKTCKEAGIILERNPQKFVWKIAIIGQNIELKSELL